MRIGVLCILLVPLNAPAQMTETDDSPDQRKEKSSITAISGTAESLSPFEVNSVLVEQYSDKPDRGYYQDFPGLFDLDSHIKSDYIATLDIGKLINPAGRDQRRESIPEFFLGVRRPYYRIGRDLRVRGTIDLKMAHPVGGIDNTLIIAFGYDFKKSRLDRYIDTKIAIVNIGFRISLPFSTR